MSKGCQSFYTNRKGVKKAYGTMTEAVSAARADYGTELEAKASEYYREHRSKTETEEGTQEDFDAYVELLQSKVNDGDTKSLLTPEEVQETDDNWKNKAVQELDEDETASLFEEDDSLDFDSTPEERARREDLTVRDDSLPTLMTPAAKRMYEEGMGEFIVLDKKNNQAYGSHRQSIVVASIFQAAMTAMEKGANASQALNIAKEMFIERRAQYYAHSKQEVFDKASPKKRKAMAIESIDDADELAGEYDMIVRNWDAFRKHTGTSMATIFGIKESLSDSADFKEDAAEDALDGYEQLDSVLERVSFDDGANFSINHKDTASARLKAFLALQRAPEKSFLNLSTFVPFDTVYDELQMMLAGVDPTYEAMVKELTIYAARKPYLNRLLSQLEKKGEQVKKDFVVAFAKQHQKHVFTDFNLKKNKGGTSMQFRNMASDRNDVVKTIQKKWLEGQKLSSMVTNKKGDLMINPEVAKQFADKVDALAQADTISVADVQDLLKLTGIEISIPALKYFAEKSMKLTNKSFQGQFKEGGAFKHLANAFVKGDADQSQEDRLLDLNNPLTGNESTSMNVLAKIEAEFTDSVFSNSWKNVEGKTIYSYGLNTNLSHQMRLLSENDGKNDTVKALSKISFQSRSEWLRRIQEDKSFRDAFGLFYLDGFKKQRSSKKGLTRGQQSTREMELQMLSLFQNQGAAAGYFIYQTISDKSTTPVISALKHNSQIGIKEDGSMMIGREALGGVDTVKSLVDIVFAEIDRINNYKFPEKGQEYSAYDVKKNSDGEWEGGAINFYMFPSVNEIIEVVEDEKNGGFKAIYDKKELTKHILNEVKDLAKAKVEKWKELGMVSEEGTMLDASYIKKRVLPGNVINKQNNEHLALYAALDMEINYIIANANAMQLISGDPATHFKGNVTSTLGDYTKRLAKDIAPGMDGAFEKGTYTMAYLEDLTARSEHLEEYAKVLNIPRGGKNPYASIDVTDAQEYTTLQEHIDVMYNYGKMEVEMYQSISAKVKSGDALSEAEMAKVLQPMKPVQVYTDIDSSRDVAMPIYIKSSSFPLIPQLTKGLEIDKMRVQMEGESGNDINRAAYKSAAKLGAKRIAKVWDSSTEKVVDNFKLNKVILQRRGFRIQQEKPYKEKKVEIVTVSQMNKLLFEGILELPPLGDEKSMKELRARKETIRKEFFNRGLEKWYKSVGVEMVAETSSNGDIEFTPKIVDITKLQKALHEEAISKGYPINDIQALRLNKKGTGFEIPLNMNTSAKKIEALLMSMLSNSAIKHKMPGKSYVQGSSAGFLTGATTGRSWEEMSQSEVNSITFSENFDATTGLKYVRKGPDGKTLPAQIIMPFFLRHKGKMLNMKDYVKTVNDKQVIDTDKLPADVLKLIGARIPNQGHSSMLPMEVVGFLPPSMGDLLIVPKEITKQMGSDFDVDSLYTYQYNYNIDPNTKVISKVAHETVQSKPAVQLGRQEKRQSSVKSFFTGESIKQSQFGKNDVMVFGANKSGAHGQGMAAFAFRNSPDNYRKWNPNLFKELDKNEVGDFAVLGKTGLMEGNKGTGYGLVTVEKPGVPLDYVELGQNIRALYDVARKNPSKNFVIPYNSDKNLNKKSLNELANAFGATSIPSNVVFGDKMLAEIQRVKGDVFESKTKDLSEKQNVLSASDKIIWGHPGIGKTTFRDKNSDRVLDFDTDFKPKVAQKLGLPVSKQNSKGLNEWRNKNNEEQFKSAMRTIWKEAVSEAKKSGKMLIVSDMMFLKENSKDFDKVITTDKDTFKKRATKRGDSVDNLDSWKDNIDLTISSVDQKKVVSSNLHFSRMVPTLGPETLSEKQAKDMESRLKDVLASIEILRRAAPSDPKIENKKAEARDIIESLRKAKITVVEKSQPPITMGKIKFNDQQNEAYYAMQDWLEGDSTTFVLEGFAGTGKTTIVKKMIEGLDSVAVSAPTHKAKEVITVTTGKKSHTVQALLGLKKTVTNGVVKFVPSDSAKIGRYKYVVVDESSMLSKELYNYLIEEAEASGTRLIFMGDPAQIPPVGEKISAVFTEAKNKAVLTKVERQSGDNPLGSIYDSIRSNLESTVDMFPHRSNLNSKGEGVEFKKDEGEFVRALMEDFKKDPVNTKYIAWTNPSVKRYNDGIRAALNPDATELFEKGDVAMMYGTFMMGEYTNSEELVVESSVKVSENGLNYLEVTFENKNAKPLRVLLPDENNLPKIKAEAKRLLDNAVKNREWRAFYAFTESIVSPVDIKFGNSKRDVIAKGIDYGYAITSHKAQGSTYENVYVNEIDMDNNDKTSERNSLKYVALSRPTKKATVLTNKSPESPVGQPVEVPESLKDSEQPIKEKKDRKYAFSEVTDKYMKDDSDLLPSEIEAETSTKETNKSLQNEYIDIHWEVLTDPRVLKRILDPLDKRGEFSIDSEAGIIHGIRSKNAASVSPLGTNQNITAYRQNKGGKDGVGVFSLASTFNAYIQGHNLRLGQMSYTDKGPVETPVYLEMFENYKLNGLSHPGNSAAGDKSSVISDMQSAAVDNAKEQTLDKVNLNMATFKVANALAQLNDGDGGNLTMQHITRFVSQKIILEFVEEVQNLSDSTTDEFFPRPELEAAARLKKKYEAEINGYVEPNEAGHTPKSLLALIENENTPDNAWYRDQIRILEEFMELDAIGQEIKNAQSALNTDSKGLGPTFFKVQDKVNKIEKLDDAPTLRGTDSLVSMTSELGLYSTGNKAAVDIYGKLLVQGSELTSETIEHLSLIINKSDKFSADDKQKMFDHLKSFMLMNRGTIVADVDASRQRLLIDSETNESIATRVKKAQETWGAENFLIRRLLAKFSDIEGDPASVTYLASTGERVDESEATKAFIDMLGSPNPEIESLGKDLVEYLYITGGSQTASNFVKFIPSIYLSIANYANRMSQKSWVGNSITTAAFVNQYMQHNPEVAPAMPDSVEKSIKNSKFMLPPVAESMMEEEGQPPKELSKFVYTEFVDGETRYNYVEFMQLRDFENNRFRLFKKNLESDTGVEYIEIDVAGGPGSMNEYRGDSYMIESDYSANKTATTPKKSRQVVTNSGKAGGANVKNDFANTNGLADYGLQTTDTKQSVMKAIDKISKESLNPAHRALAKVLLANAENSDNFTFQVNNFLEGYGRWSTTMDQVTGEVNGVISLAVNKFTDANDNFDSNQFESTLLHELIHGQSSVLITSYENAMKRGQPSPFPKDLTAAIKSLIIVKERIADNLSPEQAEKLKKFNSLSKQEKIDAPASEYSREDKALFYALGSTKEFMTQALTDVNFQKTLSEITFNSKQSILDRFLELMGKLMDSIASNLGVKVQGTELQSAVEASLNLLEATKSISQLQEDANQTNEDSLLYSSGRASKPTNAKKAKEIRHRIHFKNTFSGMLTKSGAVRSFPFTTSGFNTAISKSTQINTSDKTFKEEYSDDYKVKVVKGPKGYILGVEEYIEDSSDDDLGFDQFVETLDFEDTLDPAVQKIIEQLENRKKTLQRKSSNAHADKAMFQERIDNIDSQIEILREENSITQVGVVAGVQLDWASKMLDKKNITEGELKDVMDLIDSWSMVRDIFNDEYSGKFGRILNDINNRAKELDNKRKKIHLSRMLELTKAGTSQEIVMEDLKTMVDTSVAASLFLDISRLSNPAVQALGEWLHNAARDTNYEFTVVEQQIKASFDKLKNTAEYKKNKFDIFLQKDENGDWTGGLVTRYDQAWYEELKKQKVIRYKKGDKGWKNYFKWRKENETLVDSTVLFDPNLGERKNDSVSKKHVKALEAEFGEARAEEMIQQAEDKFLEYLSDLKAFEVSLQAELGEDTETKDYRARLTTWKIENSPGTYINSYKGSAIIKGASLRGYKYTIAKPKKIDNNGKETRWYDSNYEKIEENAELKEFYDFYRAGMDTMMKNLPTFEAEKQQANFIPFIQKDIIDKFAAGGAKAGLSGLYGNFIDGLSDSDSVMVSSDRDAKTGELNKRVPIRFLQEGDTDSKSMDLIKGLELFTLMSLNYKHKTKVEDKALLMKRLINEAAEQQMTGTGEAKKDTKGKMFQINGNSAMSNTTAAVDHAINAALYGERRKKGTPMGIVFAEKLTDSPEATKLSRQIKLLSKKHEMEQLTDEEYEEQVTPLQERLTELGGKNLTDVDVADFMVKMTQLKGMAFNVFSATTNMTFGVISNMIHAAGQEDFTTGEARKAWSMMLASTSKSLGLDRMGVGSGMAKKINNMIKKMDVLFEVNESAYNGDTKTREKNQIFSKMSPYELQKRSEYFIQGQVMIAKMLNMKATTIDGKETALWEAFDEDGNWRVDTYGREAGWEGDINNPNQMHKLKKLRNHIVQLNKRLHGNYDPNSLPMAKRSAITRFVLQFRSWVAEGFATRFEGLGFDRQLDREIKGTYRSVYDVTMQEGIVKSAKTFIKIAMRSKDGLQSLSELDKANFRKTLSEMTWVASLSLVGLLLSQMGADDDDEELNALRNITINQTYRLVADLTFWDNPTSFNSIITNPVPAMRIFSDFGKAMDATYKVMFQGDDTDGRSKMTTEKMMLKWAKNIPFGSQIPKWAAQTDKIMFK